MQRPQTEVYTASHARSFVYMSLPSPITTLYSLVMAGSLTGLAYYLGDRFDAQPEGRGGYFWFVTVVGTMTVLSFLGMGWKGLRGRKKQRQAEEFEGALKETAGGWGEEDDAAEIQRLDDLRANFQKGIDTFREYGKDVYSMPWYVIVGEPGSGKTEAIRHSDLKFPDTLQDKLQGTGGTYSMHWWFTNHAVILDTAGAMLMNPEAGQRFEEFLKLLRVWRKECPVNGMLLTIPVDSLLMDDMATAEDKARTISEQLVLIQKSLDIRFPIYLMITKSDRLPGFREFCDATGQERFDRQMVGWSNPADLDQPFHAGFIDEALTQLNTRLRARSLALLSDPIPRNPGTRRLDEVDALYTFPDTVTSLAPRLKRYLEIIFQTGEWAKRPPFFRGLYFTSAMREGATLDEELAAALGMPLNQLPQGGVWTGQKSLFLRDLFMEKIFRERGLITRLADIGRSLRRRLVVLYTTVAVILLALLGGAFLVKRGIDRDLADDNSFWIAVNNEWDNGRFLAVIDRKESTKEGVPQWEWTGDEATQRNESTRLQVLEKVKKKTDDGISGGWVFRPLSAFREMEDGRRFAWRALFEGAVIKPVLDAAREKLAVTAAIQRQSGGQADERSARALAALVELEAVLSEKDQPAFEEEKFRAVFLPLLVWACPDQNVNPDKLVSLAKVTYGKDFPFPSRRWMSQSSYLAGLGSLPDDQAPIQSGLRLFLGSADAVSQDAEKVKSLTDQLFAHARDFKTTEDQLATMAKDDAGVGFNDVSSAITRLRLAAEALGKTEQERGGVSVRLPEAVFNEMREKIRGAAERARNSDTASPVMKKVVEELSGSGGPAETVGSNPEERALVDEFIAGGAAQKRLDIYNRQLLLSGSLPVPRPGKLEEIVKDLSARTAAPPAEGAAPPPAYEGPRKDIAAPVGAFLRKHADKFVLREVCAEYVKKALPILADSLHFPLAYSAKTLTPQEFRIACDRVMPLRTDRDYFLQEDAKFPDCPDKDALMQFFGKLENVFRVLDALYNAQDKSLQKLQLALGASTTARERQKTLEFNAGTPPIPGGLLPGGGTPGVQPSMREVEQPLDQDVTSVSLQAGTRAETLVDIFSGAPEKSAAAVPKTIVASDGMRLQIFGNIGMTRNQSYLIGGRPAESLGDWGILRWLWRGIVDGTDQTIRVQLAAANPPRPFTVTVIFPKPLPAVNEWPQRSSFVQDAAAAPQTQPQPRPANRLPSR